MNPDDRYETHVVDQTFGDHRYEDVGLFAMVGRWEPSFVERRRVQLDELFWSRHEIMHLLGVHSSAFIFAIEQTTVFQTIPEAGSYHKLFPLNELVNDVDACRRRQVPHEENAEGERGGVVVAGGE